jgi:hypothetical protein
MALSCAPPAPLQDNATTVWSAKAQKFVLDTAFRPNDIEFLHAWASCEHSQAAPWRE